VVSVIVRENDTVKLAHPMTRERAPDARRISAGIHEDGVRPLAHKDRIGLADVHRDHFADGRPARSECDEHRERDDRAERRPRRPPAMRLRPARPGRDSGETQHKDEAGTRRADAYGRAWKRRQHTRDVDHPCEHPARENRERPTCPRHNAPDRRACETDTQRHLGGRHDAEVRDRGCK